MSTPPYPTPFGGDDPDALAVVSPSTEASEFARIAAQRPDLHAATGNGVPHGATAPAGKSGPARGSHAAWGVMAIALVVTLVSVGGIAFILRLPEAQGSSWPASFMGSGATSDKPMTRPVGSWADGAHEIWSLSIGIADAVVGDGEQVVVIERGPGGTATGVTAYDVSNDEPVRQWHSSASSYAAVPAYWGDYVVVGNQLFDTATGEMTTAGWGENSSLSLIGTYALECEEGICTSWSAENPGERLWSQRISGVMTVFSDSPYTITSNDVFEGDRTLVALSGSAIVDLETGELHTLDVLYEAYPRALTDGWITYDTEKGGYDFFTPTGDLVESVEFDELFGDPYPEGVPEPAKSSTQVRPSAEQRRSFLVDGDSSWSEVRVDYGQDDVSQKCFFDLYVGKASVRPEGQSDGCEHEGVYTWMVSEDEKVVALAGDPALQTNTGTEVYAMWNVTDGSKIDMVGNGTSPGRLYLLTDEVVLSVDNPNGVVTAYAPGSR